LGFLTSIFGGGEANLWTILFALAIVLVLIVAAVWVLKALFKASGSIVRGRQRRLAIIDTMAIDAKRQMILVRRDDVEHLIITGATSDLVVETGIPAPGVEDRVVPTRKDDAQKTTLPASERTSAAAQRLGLSSILRRKNQENENTPKVNVRADGLDRTREPDLSGPTGGPIDRLKKLSVTPDETANATKEPDSTPLEGEKAQDRLKTQESQKTQENKEGREAQETQEAQENDRPRPSSTPSLRHTGLLRPVSEMEAPNLGASQDNGEPQNPDSAKNKVPEVDIQAMESVEEGASPDDDGAKVKSLNDNQEAGSKGS
jgi:flagellar protein FliO/FliZ